MSVQLPDHHRGGPDCAPPAAPEDALRRAVARAAWLAEPVVALRHLPDDDALIVELLPLPSAVTRDVEDLLCIGFDGADPEALPTELCLTGLTARPDSAAARSAQHVLGDTLWAEVAAMLLAGETARDVTLDTPVLDSRMRAWRALSGMAIGIEITPGLLRTALVGPDGEMVAVGEIAIDDMSPAGVVVGIAALVGRVRAEHRITICGAPLVLGVQIAGPVDHERGVVHHYRKRLRFAEAPTWGWEDVELAHMLGAATDLTVRVFNDVVAYATLEQFQHPAHKGVLAVLLIAQGIGGKLVVDGRIDTRMPMELGNIVLHEGGRECDCGFYGCLEATAGTLAIVEAVARVTGRPVGTIGEAVVAAEPEGAPTDPAALEVFRTAGRDLARAVGTVQAIANPDAWSVYGPAELLRKDSVAAEKFFDGFYAYPQFVSFKPYREAAVNLRPVEGLEGAHGAALAALQHPRTCNGDVTRLVTRLG